MRNQNDRGPRDASSWDGTARRKVSNDILKHLDEKEQDIDMTDAFDVFGFGPFRERDDRSASETGHHTKDLT